MAKAACAQRCMRPRLDNGGNDAAPARPLQRMCGVLAELSIFDGFGCADLARVAHGITERSVTKDQVLFHRGDPCEGFHVIVSGQIKLSITSAAGNEKVVEILRPGQSFGEAVMFMDRPYVVSAQALADSTLLHIGKRTLFDEMARDPALCRRMIAGMAQRLHQLMRDLESYSLHSGRERVAAYLLGQADHAARSPDPRVPVEVHLPTHKGVIASRLNLTPEHFSRVLLDLSACELIAVYGRTIHLLDIDRLCDLIG